MAITKLALKLETIRTPVRYSEGYFHINLSFVDWREDGPHGLPSWDPIRLGKTRVVLDNLYITSQGDWSSQKEGRLYGYSLRYRDVHAIELREAKDYLRTLTYFERGLDKLTKKFGDVDNFSEYVMRVAAVANVTLVIERRADAPMGKADPEHYRTWEIGAARYHIDRLIRTWADELKPADAMGA